MGKLKIPGKELRAIGYPEGPVISIAMQVMEQNHKHLTKDEAIDVQVMSSQKQLVEVVGRFIPRIVRMDGAAPRNEWRKKSK